MTTSKSGFRLFVSGEYVQPGTYRDIETGATIEVRETDTLPDRIRIVRDERLFMRVEATCEDAAGATNRPREMAVVA
jgi:hypothetical protein